MPLSQAQPDALAQTYARSLFELAEQAGGRDTVESTLGELDELLDLARGDEAFSEFLSSRVLSAKAREGSLTRILQDRASDLTVRFLLVLNNKGRLSHLPAIAAAYDQIVQERFGRIEVDVVTASPISGDELSGLRDRLGSILSKDVVVHPYVDETIIGGIKLRIGDRLVDGSVSTHLRKLRERLGTDGAAQLRALAGDLIDGDAEPA